jgi:sugar phosphate isomerase/epimerase
MHDLGFVSAILGDRNLDEVIGFASEHHFKCVELMCWPKGRAERRYAGVTHIDADVLHREEACRIRTLLAERKVYISGLGYYPNPLDPDPEKAAVYINHLKKVIDGAKLLKVPVVNTFVGRDPSKGLEDNFLRFKKVWPDLVKFAEDRGVKIGIENCPMYFSADEWPAGKNLAVSPAIWERMFEMIPSPSFGLNYDPSHLVWQQMDEVRPLYDFKEKIFHVHLKDAKVYRDKLDRVGILATPLEYHAPKLPGLGDVNWRGFFAALTDIRYRGPVCIEVEDKAFEGKPEDILAAVLISRNYLEQHLLLQRRK